MLARITIKHLVQDVQNYGSVLLLTDACVGSELLGELGIVRQLEILLLLPTSSGRVQEVRCLRRRGLLVLEGWPSTGGSAAA